MKCNAMQEENFINNTQSYCNQNCAHVHILCRMHFGLIYFVFIKYTTHAHIFITSSQCVCVCEHDSPISISGTHHTKTLKGRKKRHKSMCLSSFIVVKKYRKVNCLVFNNFLFSFVVSKTFMVESVCASRFI